MSSLNIDLDYFTHRKVVRLIGLLGAQHVSIPIKLWCYVGRYHCEDGSLKGYSVQEIESILGWKGKNGALLDALKTVGLLDVIASTDGEYCQVHDWLEHAGHLAAMKKRAKANAEKRWGRIAREDATSIPSSTPSSNATGNASPMLPLNPLNYHNSLSIGARASNAPVDKKCATHNGNLPKAHRLHVSEQKDTEPMPEEVRSLLEKAGKGKAMP